jgi:hypothetical protein
MNSFLVTELNGETTKFNITLKNVIPLFDDRSNLQAALKIAKGNQIF